MFLKKVADYFDRLAPEWDQLGTHDSKKINLILDCAGIFSGCKVLDVACGTGVLFPYYLEREVKNITGIDLSPGMITRAKEKFDDPRLTLIVGDAEELQANDYDCCVIYSALPHFEDLGRLLKSMSKKLVVNGRFTVAHSESKEKINQRHEGGASGVSFGLMPAAELALMFSPYFSVDTIIDNNDMYVVSGIKK
jgi:demethylmenaquinone methyltransferase/2-methoxy-6-polyprenyl-1,4-benzoquinol methylase